MTCPSCGATSVSGRFCNECGHALSADAEPTRTSPHPVPARPAPRTDSDSFAHGRFAPGTLLGSRYRVVGRLGAGGMGEVYRADDLTLGHAVALKFLPEAVERDPDKLERLTAEIRTARQISHPNVCRVYDVGEADGRRFLTMEFVDGEDLRSLLRRIGRLPEDKALEIARQICAGLGAIHDKDVLHRDLKPANIMLDGRGKVRLTDFGLATPSTGSGQAECAGTPAYMAPEQFAGEPLSVATDLYALGLVLFEIFTGERLQTGESAAEISRAQQSLQSTLSSGDSGAKLDPAVQRVIARCLDPDPGRRPQSAMAVAAALPGGDPLAAALAAGETPSPQMIAAAGEDGGLSFTVAVPLLVVVVLLLGINTWLGGRNSYLAAASFPHSPEVLATKARELLERLGHEFPIRDSAYGFASDFDYLNWMRERASSAADWRHIADVHPPVIRFWYRTSPGLLRPDRFSGSGTAGYNVTRTDPPRTVPGMMSVELGPEGRLVRLDVVLPERVDQTTEPVSPDWAAVFAEAGLDIARFEPVAPEWTGQDGAVDVRVAWTGPGADPDGTPLRIEAAGYQGRAVYFRTIAPWEQPAEVPTGPSSDVTGWILVCLMFGIPAAAVALAVRNLGLGRLDRRGALRLATASGVIVLAAGLLGSPLGSQAMISLFWFNLSWALLIASIVWTFYAAVEPHVRRRWPQMLVGWSRLLDGRWRDPLVGRDLLVGSAVAVAGTAAVLLADLLLPEDAAAAPSVPLATTWGFLRFEVASVLSALPASAMIGLGFVVLLVVLRIMLRSERAAALGAGSLVFGFFMLAEGSPGWLLLLTVGLAFASLTTITVTRFGLLPLVAALFVFGVGIEGLAVPEFLRSALLLKLCAVVAPAVFGFYTATRGRASADWLET